MTDAFRFIAHRLQTTRVIIGPPLRWIHSALHGNPFKKQLRRVPQSLAVSFPSPDGLTLSGEYYPAATWGPGLVIVHGWDPQGQHHGLYIALADTLRRSGISVLTVNLRGYPGSDCPPTAEGFNLSALTGDVQSAVSFLVEQPDVDPRRLILYGHSYGAGLVIPTLAADPRVWRGIIHGPSRWVEERITGPNGQQRSFFHERYWRYMTVDDPVPLEVYLRVKRGIYLLEQRDLLPAGHRPLLIVDGNAEGENTKRFSARLLETLPPPCSYLSIPGSDHFCNTARFGKWLVVDSNCVGTLADALIHWLRDADSTADPSHQNR